MDKEREFGNRLNGETMNDKELLQLIKNRRSIRKFKNIPIKKEDLLELVEAGIFAPSGSNTQCYGFLVITRQSDIDFLAKHKLGIINRAKAVIMVVADLNKCNYLKKGRSTVFDKLPYQDTATAMQNICLLAESKGIGNCIIHMSNNLRHIQKIRERFNLSNNYEFMGLILLGYSNEIVDYETATHAGRPIKRGKVEEYIVDWRE